jgi:hypothetical protein
MIWLLLVLAMSQLNATAIPWSETWPNYLPAGNCANHYFWEQ